MSKIQSLGNGDPHPVETIAEEAGPQAAGLVVSLLESSRAETDAITDRVMEGKDADIERLTQERNEAWSKLERVERRVMNLLFAPTSPLDDPVFD